MFESSEPQRECATDVRCGEGAVHAAHGEHSGSPRVHRDALRVGTRRPAAAAGEDSSFWSYKKSHFFVSLQPSLAVKAVVLLRLKMLSMLFATLDTRPCLDEELDVSEGSSEGLLPSPTARRQGEPQPVFLVLQRVLPVLDSVAAAWGNDLHVMDVSVPSVTLGKCVVAAFSHNTVVDVKVFFNKSLCNSNWFLHMSSQPPIKT